MRVSIGLFSLSRTVLFAALAFAIVYVPASPSHAVQSQLAEDPSPLESDAISLPIDNPDPDLIAELTEKLEATDDDKSRVAILESRINAYMKAGQFTEAAEDYQTAIEIQPDNTMHWMRRGILLSLADKQMAYVELAQHMLDRFKETTGPYNAERTAKMCWLPEQPLEGRKAAEGLADMAVKQSSRTWGEYYPSTRGLGHLRYGEYKKALEAIETSDELNSKLGTPRLDLSAINHCVRAMALSKTGRHADAASSLVLAKKLLKTHFDNADLLYGDSAWHNWLTAKLLYDEARMVLAENAEREPPENKESIEEQIRSLIPAATAIDRKTFEKIATGSEAPTKDDFPEQSLTAALMFIDYEKASATDDEFQYLTDKWPEPALIAAEMYHTIGSGRLRLATKPVTMIQEKRISELKVKVDGDKATGSFKFLVPKLYQGSADFFAVRKEDVWQITEFRMNKLGIHVSRDDSGKWQEVDKNESTDSETPEIDFQCDLAPADIRILASRELILSLHLSDEQRQKIILLARNWRDEYASKKAEMDALDPEDQISRRGWPPTRDHQLRSDIEDILVAAQKPIYQKMIRLWERSPVRADAALQIPYVNELELSDDQHRQLFALNVQWVEATLPKPWDHRLDTLEQRLELEREITNAAWRFKSKRDKSWREILTDEQATRWQQIELQQMLIANGLELLHNFLSLDHQERESGKLMSTGTYVDSYVPYFSDLKKELAFTDQQRSKLAKFSSSETVEGDSELPGKPVDKTRAYYDKLRTESDEAWHESMREFTKIMTDDQKLRWSELIGKPAEIYKRYFE